MRKKYINENKLLKILNIYIYYMKVLIYQTGQAREKAELTEIAFDTSTPMYLDAKGGEVDKESRVTYHFEHHYLSHAEEAKYEAQNFKKKYLSGNPRYSEAGFLKDYKYVISIGSSSTQGWEIIDDDVQVIIPPTVESIEKYRDIALYSQIDSKSFLKIGTGKYKVQQSVSQTTEDNINNLADIIRRLLSDPHSHNQLNGKKILLINSIGYANTSDVCKPINQCTKENTDPKSKTYSLDMFVRTLSRLLGVTANNVDIFPRGKKIANESFGGEWVAEKSLETLEPPNIMVDMGGGAVYVYVNGEKIDHQVKYENGPYIPNDHEVDPKVHMSNMKDSIIQIITQKIAPASALPDEFSSESAPLTATSTSSPETEAQSASPVFSFSLPKTETQSASPYVASTSSNSRQQRALNAHYARMSKVNPQSLLGGTKKQKTKKNKTYKLNKKRELKKKVKKNTKKESKTKRKQYKY
jgi:hypothetical protein